MHQPTLSSLHEHEIRAGQRFAFGKNWARYLAVLNEERIDQAKASLQTLLNRKILSGESFLDAGSGSGLFSLAARQLGAHVHSFDYDPQSVACTRELKRRYFDDDPLWTVEQGSVLDECYLQSLGQFDIVYSWGVLHHTGDMWGALGHIHNCVKLNGLLAISLYNDQGSNSKKWAIAKRIYNHLPGPLKLPYACLVLAPRQLRVLLSLTLRLKPHVYFQNILKYSNNRGMSWWHDQVDWIGGYPFEVATPDSVFRFFQQRGYALLALKTCGGDLGCNEFAFQRSCVSDVAVKSVPCKGSADIPGNETAAVAGANT